MSNQIPMDDTQTVMSLIYYLRMGSEQSTDNPQQAQWFLQCAEWVEKKFNESFESQNKDSISETQPKTKKPKTKK